MQALILAAGKGSRLDDHLGRPKCLREVGDVPLLHHQLAALAAVDVLDVLVVVGYEQASVRDSVGLVGPVRHQRALRRDEQHVLLPARCNAPWTTTCW